MINDIYVISFYCFYISKWFFQNFHTFLKMGIEAQFVTQESTSKHL